MASDLEAGMRSLQLAGGAAALAAFCGYFAARQLSKPFVDDSIQNRAMIIAGIGGVAVVIASVYAAFVIYQGSARTKMLATFALLISLGGSYAGWTVGWKKGGAPETMHVL